VDIIPGQNGRRPVLLEPFHLSKMGEVGWVSVSQPSILTMQGSKQDGHAGGGRLLEPIGRMLSTAIQQLQEALPTVDCSRLELFFEKQSRRNDTTPPRYHDQSYHPQEIPSRCIEFADVGPVFPRRSPFFRACVRVEAQRLKH